MYDLKTVQLVDLVRTEDYLVKAGITTDGLIFLHLFNFPKWGPSVYKQLLYILDVLMEKLHAEGIDEVYALIPADDPKLLKFESMLGFEIVGEAMSEQGKQLLILGQSTEL